MKLSHNKETFDFYRSNFIANLNLALDVDGIPPQAVDGINKLIAFFSAVNFDDSWELNCDITLVTCQKEFNIGQFSSIMGNGMAIMAKNK